MINNLPFLVALRLTVTTIIISCVGGGLLASVQLIEIAQAGQYKNPVLDRDFPFPTIFNHSLGHYYLYGASPSSPSSSLRIQAAFSTDLLTWQYHGEVLSNPPSWLATAGSDSLLSNNVSCCSSPSLLASHRNGVGPFYLYFAAIIKNGSSCVGVATAPLPLGPFSPQDSPLLCNAVDPMVLADPYTNKFFLYYADLHGRAIYVQELDSSLTSLASPAFSPTTLIRASSVLPYENFLTAPWLQVRGYTTHKDEYHFLFFSGEGDNNAVMVSRSKSATGPFEGLSAKSNVVMEKTSTVEAPARLTVIRDHNGDDWGLYNAFLNQDTSKSVVFMDKLMYHSGWAGMRTNSPSTISQTGPSTHAKEDI